MTPEKARTVWSRGGKGVTVKNGLIEIQGDQREKIAEALKKLGYRVKHPA